VVWPVVEFLNHETRRHSHERGQEREGRKMIAAFYFVALVIWDDLWHPSRAPEDGE
jgi:hypothetical protein